MRGTHLSRMIKLQHTIIYTVVNVLNIYIHWKKSTYPKLIIDVPLKHASTILLLRMLHQYIWLSHGKSTWWVIVCSNLHKLSVTLSANVNINYRLPIKVDYRICTVRHIRMEIILSFNIGWRMLVKKIPFPPTRDKILVSANPC